MRRCIILARVIFPPKPRLRYTLVLRIGFLLWTIGTGLKLLFNRETQTAVFVVVMAVEGAGVGWVHQPGT